jgi:hypothetical protein
MRRILTALRHRRGSWIGRKTSTVLGARGIPDAQSRRILAERATELRRYLGDHTLADAFGKL